MFEKQFRVWLEVGIMSNMKDGSVDINTSGTPQDGVISPFLANIAPRGM